MIAARKVKDVLIIATVLFIGALVVNTNLLTKSYAFDRPGYGHFSLLDFKSNPNKFKNIADNYADDFTKLGTKELKYLKELSDHAGKLDNAILRGIEIPAGTIVGDIPLKNLDAALDLAKHTDQIIDITKVTKYGDNAIKHGDDIFVKLGDGSIKHIDEIEDLVDVDRAVRQMELEGHMFPCVVPVVGWNPLNTLFPVAYASGGCVKKLGVNTFDVGGKSLKGTAEEAGRIADHLKNGGQFDVDNYHKLINNNGNNPLKNITEYFNWQRIETEFKDLGYTLKKSDDYRSNFINSFEQSTQDLINNGSLQIDHRLPWNFVKNHPDVAKEALDILGIKDLNDPRLMQAISQTNNLNLNKPWNDFLANNPLPSAQQVVDMIMNAGKDINFVPPPIRLENSI